MSAPSSATFAGVQEAVASVPRRLGRGYWLLVAVAFALVVMGG